MVLCFIDLIVKLVPSETIGMLLVPSETARTDLFNGMKTLGNRNVQFHAFEMDCHTYSLYHPSLYNFHCTVRLLLKSDAFNIIRTMRSN